MVIFCNNDKFDILFTITTLIFSFGIANNCHQCNYSTDIKWDYSYPHLNFVSPVKDFWHFIKSTDTASLFNHDMKEHIYYDYMTDIMNATKNRLLIIASGVIFIILSH